MTDNPTIHRSLSSPRVLDAPLETMSVQEHAEELPMPEHRICGGACKRGLVRGLDHLVDEERSLLAENAMRELKLEDAGEAPMLRVRVRHGMVTKD